MSRAVDRGPVRPASRPSRSAPALTVRKFSTLEEARKKTALARVNRIVERHLPGHGSLQGDRDRRRSRPRATPCCWSASGTSSGVAVYHAPGVSEAPGRRALREVPGPRRRRRAGRRSSSTSWRALEEVAQELGLTRVILPVYLRYWLAYSTLVRCGYQIDFTLVRMQKGKGGGLRGRVASRPRRLALIRGRGARLSSSAVLLAGPGRPPPTPS